MKKSAVIVLFCTLVGVQCMTSANIAFMGETLPNHAYVDLSLVGDDVSGSDSVHCNTNLRPCCEPNGVRGVSENGNWFAPANNGSTPLLTDRTDDLYVVYGRQMIDLRQRNSNGNSGIYHCEIVTVGPGATVAIDDSIIDSLISREILYVGLYANGGGLKTAGGMTITFDRYRGNPQFTLTCKTTGGPATYVTWIGGSALARGQKKSVLNDPVSAEYTHTLTVRGTPRGSYMCRVANRKPSTADATFNVEEDLFRLLVVSTSSKAVEISWSLAKNVLATSYTISYSNTNNTQCFTDSDDITGIAGSKTMYTLTGLEEGTEYSITVTARVSNGLTFKKTISASTIPSGPSAAPTNMNITEVTDTSITVQWGPVECIHHNGDITGYTVQYGEVGNGSTHSLNVTGNEATISGLTPMITYAIEVAAVNSFSIGVYSSTTMQTHESISSNSLSVSANSIGNTSICLSLILNEDWLKVTNYTISYSNTNNTQCFTDSDDITGIAGSETMYTLTGLEEGTEYSITVTATLSNGQSVTTVSVYTTIESGPSAPPNLVGVSKVTSSNITVQWGSVECIHVNGEITGYSVQYGEVGSESTQTLNVTGDIFLTTITGLLPDTLYSVQVAAVSSISEGPYSEPIQVSTFSQQSIATPTVTVTAVTAAPTISYMEAALMSGSLGFLIGVIVALLATICIFVVLNRCKASTKKDLKAYIPSKEEVMLSENAAYSSVLSVRNSYQEEVIYEHVT